MTAFSTHYESAFTCHNCKFENVLIIPKGQRVIAWMIHTRVECQNCKVILFEECKWGMLW